MTSIEPLSADSFPMFFEALWGYSPFPWQTELARRLCAGESPDYVTVPTGSGKTACLDAALFALAVQATRPPNERTVGRRIFFIVNRRIIVDEAFDRAKRHLVPALSNPGRYLNNREKKKSEEKRISEVAKTNAIKTLQSVADKLCSLSGTNEPLACVELRGGIYRDRAWAKSLIQPMIICSTVDQAGSRLLFRGYGVSPEARPIHAALVAHDSVLLIDEAHIVQPFLQTLEWVQRYRCHAPAGSEPVNTLPFSVVRMTATPPKDVPDSRRLDLTAADRNHPVLNRRLTASKMATLVAAPNAKGKSWIEKLALALHERASAIIIETKPRSIAIMVNRVATAREVFALMRKSHKDANVCLLLGRMRPLDRDQVTRDLQAVLKTGEEVTATINTKLQIVVSTQCLEVGADLDFDALVTECASIDALRQRFGRLNRGGRNINARAAIVFPEESAKETPPDPIYGVAISRTWIWLQAQAVDGVIDFGLESMTKAITLARSTNEEDFFALLTPRCNAPVLLPAYLDCWVQTNPGPAADPNVAIFLHGPQRDMADVQVCWRADLPAQEDLWAETIGLCPPTSLECLPVPLQLMRQWLSDDSDQRDISGDAPSTVSPDERQSGKIQRKVSALIWRGENKNEWWNAANLRPGDTLVLRAQDQGWEDLGHLPGATAANVDQSELGVALMKRKAIVRLHPELFPITGTETLKLLNWAKAKEGDKDVCEWRLSEIQEVLTAAADELHQINPLLTLRLRHIAATKKRLDVEYYPDETGVVLSAREPFILAGGEEENGSPDDGPNDPLLDTSQPQGLDEHTAHVKELAETYLEALGLGSYSEAIIQAATLHDIGKADRRFQAMLIGSDVAAAMARLKLLAKSATRPTSPKARERIRVRATMPNQFRHEMLSVKLAETPAADSLLPTEPHRKALALHLIASHHGQARPFALVVDDLEPPSVQVSLGETTLSLTQRERSDTPAHALDAGLATRFWQLTRHHGWWGLALLEAIIRLADQTASANPKPSIAP